MLLNKPYANMFMHTLIGEKYTYGALVYSKYTVYFLNGSNN